MNSCNTDIFFSNYYHLLSVRFEFIYSQTPANPIKVPNASTNYPCLQMKECLSIFLGLMNFMAFY